MPRTNTERQKIRDDHPDSWIAVNPGDSIMGRVVDAVDAWSAQRRNPATGRPGSSYPLLTIEAQEISGGYDDVRLPHEFKVHCFGAVLYNEIMRKQPNVGERIRIVYQGVGESKPGQNPPELYSVRSAAGGETAKRAYATINSQNSRANRSDAAQSIERPAEQPTLEDDIPF